jgi:hypothetical protein
VEPHWYPSQAALQTKNAANFSYAPAEEKLANLVADVRWVRSELGVCHFTRAEWLKVLIKAGLGEVTAAAEPFWRPDNPLP